MGSGNKLLVSVFILLTFAIWIAFDAWLGPNGGPTESQVIMEWARSTAFFPELLGFLCGHWFFQRRSIFVSGWMWGIVIWALLIPWDIWWHFHYPEYHPWYRYGGYWCLIGIPAGMFLWNQRKEDSPIA